MKRNRIRVISLEVVVGAFMFMVILALGAFTIILSRQSLFKTTVRYEISFPGVMGIREGDNVLLRGVTVGKIERIQATHSDVRVTVALDRELELREDYSIEILSASMLGGRLVSIDEGDDIHPLLPPDTPLVGRLPVDLIEEATRVVTSIRDALENGILADARTIISNANSIVARVERGEGSLGKLLNEDELYNDVRAVAANLRSVSDRLDQGEGSIGRLLADDGKIYEDIEAVTANLRKVSDDLAAGKGLLGKLLSEQDDGVYEDLRATAQAIREVAEGINRGDGTLGKLITDDDIYDEAKLLLRELRATVDDFRETVPVTTFTSIFLGAF